MSDESVTLTITVSKSSVQAIVDAIAQMDYDDCVLTSSACQDLIEVTMDVHEEIAEQGKKLGIVAEED